MSARHRVDTKLIVGRVPPSRTCDLLQLLVPHCRLCYAWICRPGHRPLHRVLLSNRGLYLKLGGFEQLPSEQYHRVSRHEVVEERADMSHSQWKRAVTAVGA